jgi:hypothetical protein
MAPVVHTDVQGEPASPLLRQVSMNAWKSVVPGSLVSVTTLAQAGGRASYAQQQNTATLPMLRRGSCQPRT